MSTDFAFEAATRDDTLIGKGASRRLRRLEDRIPAIVYGGNKKAESIVMDHNKLMHALEDEAIYTSVITLNIDGKNQKVMLKDLQRHPFKPKLVHADFIRVTAKSEVTVNVPVHLVGECPALKENGVMTQVTTEIEVKCLPSDLPESIELDVSEMVIGQTLHLSDMTIPKALTPTAGGELAIVNVQESRASKLAAQAAAAEAGEESEGDNTESSDESDNA